MPYQALLQFADLIFGAILADQIFSELHRMSESLENATRSRKSEKSAKKLKEVRMKLGLISDKGEEVRMKSVLT